MQILYKGIGTLAVYLEGKMEEIKLFDEKEVVPIPDSDKLLVEAVIIAVE